MGSTPLAPSVPPLRWVSTFLLTLALVLQAFWAPSAMGGVFQDLAPAPCHCCDCGGSQCCAVPAPPPAADPPALPNGGLTQDSYLLLPREIGSFLSLPAANDRLLPPSSGGEESARRRVPVFLRYCCLLN